MKKTQRKNLNATSVSLTKALVDEIVDISFSHSESSAIELAVRSVLADGKLPKHSKWDVKSLLPDSTGENWAETYHARNFKKTVKISVSHELLDELDTACSQKYPELKTLSERIEYCMIAIIVEYQNATLDRPIRLPGSKWGEMKNVSRTVLDGRKYKTIVETCAGALGVFSNIDCAEEIILNDYDTGKYCFYGELRANPTRLLNKLLSNHPSVEKCKRYEKKLKEIDPSSLKKQSSGFSNEEIADMFFYRNYYYKNRRDKGQVPLYGKPPLEYVCRLLKVAERLRGLMLESPETYDCPRTVRLSNQDLLELIPKHNSRDTLIICDPPYLHTRTYEENLTMAQHKQLSHLLNKHKGDFIFYCRLTERSHNESYESPMLRAFITDMYASFEHYFMDIQTRDGLERVITNFQFDGGTPYTAEADAIKMKADAQKEEDAEQNLSSDEKGGDSDEK